MMISTQQDASSRHNSCNSALVSKEPLRVVCLSDTHGLHTKPQLLQVPAGDLLIFGGDAGLETEEDVSLFDAWLGSLPHPHKVVVWGNMDLVETLPNRRPSILQNGLVLLDKAVDIKGYRICGSPWTPKHYGAFQLESRQAATTHWESVLPPDADIDILVTHGPPYGYGDETRGRHVGDQALLAAVNRLQRPPLLWVVGHIHESYGQQHAIPHPRGQTMLINAAVAYLGRRVPDAVPRVVDLPACSVSFQPLPDRMELNQVWKAEPEYDM